MDYNCVLNTIIIGAIRGEYVNAAQEFEYSLYFGLDIQLGAHRAYGWLRLIRPQY